MCPTSSGYADLYKTVPANFCLVYTSENKFLYRTPIFSNEQLSNIAATVSIILSM